MGMADQCEGKQSFEILVLNLMLGLLVNVFAEFIFNSFALFDGFINIFVEFFKGFITVTQKFAFFFLKNWKNINK